ncbi:MAG: ROK family protein, partial [Lentisphaerae bacterium]|nr:ROK family protein [Lentisphaerota bacterium]
MAEAKKLWLGFDLGGTKMCAHVFDDAFKVLGFQKRKTKAQEGKEATLQRIFQTIREALDNAGASPEQLAGIGMGCPGPVDHTCGV